jgi:hypothetical protein
MFTFKVFNAVLNPLVCDVYIEGHIKVLKDYGITNITSNNNDWVNWDSVYGIYAEDENGKMVGGIRVQRADGIHPLPVENAIGKMDKNIYKVVNNYRGEGVCELCALWNAKEVAGLGLSVLLVRAGISITNQINCKTMVGICAEYTLDMFKRVGFEIDYSLGNKGEFIYPNENYIARVVGILNVDNLQTADKTERENILAIRESTNQVREEIGKNNNIIKINYALSLKQYQVV